MGQKTDAETKNDTLSSYKIFNLVDTLIQQVSDNIIKLVGEQTFDVEFKIKKELQSFSKQIVGNKKFNT